LLMAGVVRPVMGGSSVELPGFGRTARKSV
jgi:hypothetical protein